jgi:hypothetical protein
VRGIRGVLVAGGGTLSPVFCWLLELRPVVGRDWLVESPISLTNIRGAEDCERNC